MPILTDGSLYIDYKRIAVTDTEQSYTIGTQSGTPFGSERIRFLADEDCYVRFNEPTALQILIKGKDIWEFEKRVTKIYVVRVSANGNLEVWAEGDIPSAIKGRYRAVLERLVLLVGNSLNEADYDEYYVTGDYTQLPTNLSKMPYVTVRINPVLIEDETYGRRLPSVGSMATHYFTLYVYETSNTVASENKNRDAHICARTIMDFLRGKDQDSTEGETYGIYRIYDIGARESEPEGLRGISRMIVTGAMWVKRLDSP